MFPSKSEKSALGNVSDCFDHRSFAARTCIRKQRFSRITSNINVLDVALPQLRLRGGGL